MIINLLNEQATEQFAAILWSVLPQKCLLFLKGDLGVGKTTLTRAMLRAAGYKAVVKSPTYTLVEEYVLASGKFFHFDLYRLKDPEELAWIGIRDYFEQASLCCIEWPELGQGYLPKADIELTMKMAGGGRVINMQVYSEELEKKIRQHCKNNNILLQSK